MFKPHLKGSARLQGFTLRGQYFFSRALQGFSKASLSLFKPSSQGPCKVCMTESNLSLLCLCDPPREGFSKASVSLFKPFSQGLCKASARDPSFCSKILVKGYAREGFNKRSSSSFNQSDMVPETNRYAPPTSWYNYLVPVDLFNPPLPPQSVSPSVSRSVSQSVSQSVS